MRAILLLLISLLLVPQFARAQTTAPALATPSSVVTVALPAKMPSSPGYFCVDATVSAGHEKFTMSFGIFLPANYFKEKSRFPIVIALHNDGMYGTGGAPLTGEGLASLWVSDNWDQRDAEKRTNLPAITLRKTAMFIGLAPQCPAGHAFDRAPIPQAIAELATQISKLYRADRQRTYLTGFSFGGTNCWRIAEQLPRQFAAIVPISSRNTADPARTVQQLQGMPVYLACGTAEWALPCCQAMNNALDQAKHPDHVFKVIDGGTHWCYASVYSDPDFWRWLFSKKSTPPSPRTTAAPSTASKP